MSYGPSITIRLARDLPEDYTDELVEKARAKVLSDLASDRWTVYEPKLGAKGAHPDVAVRFYEIRDETPDYVDVTVGVLLWSLRQQHLSMEVRGDG